MAEGSGEEKRHAPSAQRLRQAAERGNTARSVDLPKAAVVVCVTALALGAAAGLGAHVQAYCANWLIEAGTAPVAAAAGWAGVLAAQFFSLLALIAAIAFIGSLLPGGWVFSLGLLKPDFTKLLPSHGLGQLISRPGMTETVKALLKFILIGGTGALLILGHGAQFAALAAMAHARAMPVVDLVLRIIASIAMVLCALAAGDAGLQFWLHHQKLRMTDNEVRDEMKDAVGNPQVRSRQRLLARKLARARQMNRITEASVIVTNPTHFAVAIRYRRGVDRAPLLLAKGVGLLAQEILSRGRALGIPVVEAPPLARAVYRHVEPGEPIPVALYRACAEVLAYVWKMQRWRAQGGPRPAVPKVQDGEIEMARAGKVF